MGRKNKDAHPCEGCQMYGIRDYGYGPHERHDAYCWLYGIWNPSRCKEYDDQEEQ